SMRQVSALVPNHSVSAADAVLVCGGSAYGLDAAGGVLAWLEEQGRGTRVGSMRVPSVPSAAVFDLFTGNGRVRPDRAMGRDACLDAREAGILEGRVGAGAGATVGKLMGLERAAWGGVGVAGVELPGGLVVTAMAVVNAFGSVRDPETRAFVAGAFADDGLPADPTELVMAGVMGERLRSMTNTTIGVIVTNASLDQDACRRAAVMAGQALPDCIVPCQTMVDGDMVFAASAGEIMADPHQVGIAGRKALSRAVIRAVTAGERTGPSRPGSRTEAEQ
ncbi:MAG: peptidase S58 family protein, partial [Deltaproteobacteria bacterium]|nr:peptidase S58 family protein [Deltaproteobacteria bacterium]